jgi:alginate O-acetyltransferase complex protein AlgI
VLFNSYEFLFVFLPVTLCVYLSLDRWVSRSTALTWLVVASLGFYSWWNPPYVFFLGCSILGNYVLARTILATRTERPRLSATIVLAGVAANLALIGYYKYKNFFLDGVEFATGISFPGQELILPLGISFFTFQQIAYLADARVGAVGKDSLRDYALFVTFFPQLIAGPIVHHKEMMPQFADSSGKSTSNNLVIGAVLFSVGLFKKAIIADGLAAYANPVFDMAATGSPIDLFTAWQGALAYAMQLYFDFSGYSEMALGLARMFGVVLPMNFNSPFKQSSIIDFWGHWHITLTRFFTAYIYNPIALRITRARVKRRAVMSRADFRAFFALVAFPTMVTMTLAGLWHGAGMQFIIFGVLHGSYLTINHAWRQHRRAIWPDERSYALVMRPLGWLITFTGVVVAMVFFRAESVAVAAEILQGMLGFNGAQIPSGLAERFPLMASAASWFGIEPALHLGKEFVTGAIWIGACLAICLLCPNILQILRLYNPALGMGSTPATDESPSSTKWHRLVNWRWEPTPSWLAVHVVILVVGILGLSQVTEFLYWQF